MKFLSLNCQSFKTAKKDISNLVDNYNLDILCLTETWESDSEKVQFKNWQILSRPRKQNAHGGVAILNKRSDKFIILRKPEFEKDDVEAICATVKLQDQDEILLVTAYIPPEKNEQMKGLIEIIKNCNTHHKNIIVTGDFNAKSKLWGNKNENCAGELLERCIVSENFVCVNDGFQTRRNSESVIDLFIVKPHLNRSISRFLL